MKHNDEVPLITTMTSPAYLEKRKRIRNYFILMSFRIPALLVACFIACYAHMNLLAVLIVGLSIPIPWIAVILANDRLPVKRNKKIAVISHNNDFSHP